MRINYKVDWQALGTLNGSKKLGPKKAQILEAALRILATSGLHNLTLTKISSTTKLSKPLILYHYESNNKILEDLYFYIAKMYEYFISTSHDSEESFEVKIAKSVTAQIKWFLFNKNVAQFITLMPHLAYKSYYLKKYAHQHNEFLQKNWEYIFLESLRFQSLEVMRISINGHISLINGTLSELIHQNQTKEHLDVVQKLKFNLEQFHQIELPTFEL